MNCRLLAIDDDPLILESIRYALAGKDIVMSFAQSADEGLKEFARQSPNVVILDVRLPDQSGMEVFEQIRQRDDKVLVLFITGYGNSHTAIEAMRLGAFDYVTKPFAPDRLVDTVTRALEVSRLMQVPTGLADGAEPQDASTLMGHCPAMEQVHQAIRRAAPRDVPVLILGEIGSGKELVAQTIHNSSRRSAAPFAVINCEAMPEAVLESELFGHRGLSPVAEPSRSGKLQQCCGGTLFLDELASLTPSTQVKLLRVLEEGRFTRPGTTEAIATDVRLLVATNRELGFFLNESCFCWDLFHALSASVIHLEPLRQRPDDLPLLANHFFRRFGRELGHDVHAISPRALELLQAYPWPGNVRQLQSVIKQTLVHMATPVVLVEDLPDEIRLYQKPVGTVRPAAEPADLLSLIRQRLRGDSLDVYAETHLWVDRLLLSEALSGSDGNLSQAARRLGIARQTLRSRLTELGIFIERTAAWEEPHHASL